MIAYFLSNISAKYYKNPSILCRVIAKNVGDVFFETQCRILESWEMLYNVMRSKQKLSSYTSNIIHNHSSSLFITIYH